MRAGGVEDDASAAGRENALGSHRDGTQDRSNQLSLRTHIQRASSIFG
jgi:hypothetical protein